MYGESLAEQAGAEVSDRFSDWARDEMGPEVAGVLQEIAAETDESVQAFYDELQEVRGMLTGVGGGDAADYYAMFEDVAERVGPARFGGVGGLNAGTGVAHLAKQLAATFGVLTVWAFSPFGLIPLAIGVAMTSNALLIRAREEIEANLRKEVANELAKKVRAEAPDNADKAAQRLADELAPIKSGVITNLEGRVGELRAQVEAALRALEQGEEVVAERRAELTKTEALIRQANDDLEDLISDVAIG
jgi:hypothetical protein